VMAVFVTGVASELRVVVDGLVLAGRFLLLGLFLGADAVVGCTSSPKDAKMSEVSGSLDAGTFSAVVFAAFLVEELGPASEPGGKICGKKGTC